MQKYHYRRSVSFQTLFPVVDTPLTMGMADWGELRKSGARLESLYCT